jgi:hypothetical protein
MRESLPDLRAPQKTESDLAIAEQAGVAARAAIV